MRHRAGIFRELNSPQKCHVFHTLHRSRPHVGGKFRVTKNRKAFFQAELKPVAAGDAITGPVVKVFVGNHRLDTLKRQVGLGFGTRQYAGGIKYIQPLVFHRPHVEIIHGDDHKNIQVVFPAIDFFIPVHGIFQ